MRALLLVCSLAIVSSNDHIVRTVQVLGSSVTLTASDGTKVNGVVRFAEGAPRGWIVLFHQAHSNANEYLPIAERLSAEGYSTLAIDQRAGGPMFGRKNETAAQFREPPGYLDAMPDLEAALAEAVKRNGGKPVIVVGSSYSATLVFALAAKHPSEVKAIVAFSPGEYFPDKHFARDAAARVKVPIFVTSASDAEEIAQAKEILAAAPSSEKVQFVPKHGVHGASTLRTDRDPQGAEENWAALLKFLSSLR